MKFIISGYTVKGNVKLLERLAIFSVGLSLGLVMAIVLFNRALYPVFGLESFKKEQYRQALVAVGRSYAASEGLTFQSVGHLTMNPHGTDTLAWGTLVLRTPAAEEVDLWASLKWSPFWHRWLRYNCRLLADPRDRILFAESLLALGNFGTVYSTLENLSREELRRWREVWQGDASARPIRR
jgi:hypothetical protein